MSIKNLNIFHIFLCLLVFNFATSGALNCKNWSASKCKSEFSKLFDKESKAAYSTLSINLLEKFVEVYSGILTELPQNDQHRDPIIKLLENLNSKIESFKQGDENVEDTVSFLLLKIKKYDANFEGINFDADSQSRYKTIEKKYVEKCGIAEALSQESGNIYIEILNTWSKHYSDLREIDLKTYPEYLEVNYYYQGLKASELKMKSMMYQGAIEKTTKFLELNYMKNLLDKEHEMIFGNNK